MNKIGLFTVIALAAAGCAQKPSGEKPPPSSEISASPGATAPSPETAPAIPASNPAKEAPWLNVPLGLDNENLNIPPDNPLTPEKVALGKLLYFDARLSGDGKVSCASCHNPEQGWTDNEPVSSGIHGKKGTISAPTVVNATYMGLQFWDGRAATLEEQSLGPIVNPVEMGMASHDAMIAVCKNIPGYAAYFKKAFGDETITKERVSQAIASFERTILSGNSRYDRWTFGDKMAMNESEVRGRDLFFGKANCTRCHAGPNFSDSQFHNLGVGQKKPKPDQGRFAVTKAKEDRGAFKTPTVRDITRTAPYMHDGSEATLEAVVEFYNRGGEKNPNLAVQMEPLNLNDQEKADLVAFMKALDGNPYPLVPVPELPQ
ncbi:MAG TPA: cytochrome c peroxidase [bacterium]|nr:cytochrome c peroxidase [bacterium]